MTDFTQILTPAGKALCLSLGLLNPNYNECSMMLMRQETSCDAWLQCPFLNMGATDAQWAADTAHKDYDGCIKVATYKTYDGTPGGNYFCWRDATVHWIPEAGRWKYIFPEKKP